MGHGYTKTSLTELVVVERLGMVYVYVVYICVKGIQLALELGK